MKKLSIMLVVALTCGVSEAQLLNPGFEQPIAGPNADNWTKSGACNREGWANQESGGSQGMAFEWWQGASGDFYQDVEANAGAEYTLGAWYQDDAAAVASSVYNAKLQWYDSTMTLISENVQSLSPLLDQSWQPLSFSATAPINAATVRVLFDADAMISGETVKIDAITLTFADPLGAAVITNQPAYQSVSAGANVTFSVGVSNTAGVSYQWQFFKTNIANGGSISGATSQTLTITGASASDAGHYRVRVTNGAGVVTSQEGTLAIVGISFYPVVTIDGKIGDTYRSDFANALAPTTWIPFSTNVLTSSPQLVIDAASAGSNTRFYRSVYLP